MRRGLKLRGTLQRARSVGPGGNPGARDGWKVVACRDYRVPAHSSGA